MNQHQKKDEVILMSHGGGGTRTKSIINDIILKNLGNAILAKLDDAAGGVCIRLMMRTKAKPW